MSSDLEPLPRDKKGNVSLRKFFRQIIHDRNDTIETNLNFLDRDQNWYGVTTPYYELRNRLGHLGYNLSESYNHPIYDVYQEGPNKGKPKPRWGRIILDDMREYIQSKMLTEICEELGKRRDQLGIYVQARSTFAFRGNTSSIGLEDIEEFKEKGVIIGLVEKSNIARKLAPYLQNYGIALIENGGNFVEYAKILCQKAYTLGCNIAYLTDNDISGYAMCIIFPFGKRIAIDLAGVRELARMKREQDLKAGISVKSEQELIEEVQERYNPNENQMTFIYDKFRCLRAIYNDKGSSKIASIRDEIEEYGLDKFNLDTLYKLMANGGETMEFIKTRRIELDLVIKVFGPELFAKYIAKQIREKFEINDYQRAVDLEKGITYPRPIPEEAVKFVLDLIQFFCDAGLEKHSQIDQKLADVYGILDLSVKEKMFGDKIIQAEKLDPRVQKVLKKLEKFKIPKLNASKKSKRRSDKQ